MNNDKTKFLLGMTTAVAIISLFGFVSMSIAYVNKGDSEDNNGGKTAVNDSGNTAPSPAPKPSPSPSAAPAAAPIDIEITGADHIRGNADAPITIVEYSDFQCPYCARFHQTMQEVMANYGDDVRWIYRHFPLDSIHPYARQAAEAAECAGDQGKFWEYADKLVENQSKLNADLFPRLALDLGLNTKEFDNCVSSGKFKDRVNSDFQKGRDSGVTGTPGNFINGTAVKGAVPYSQISAMIDDLL